MFGDHRHERLEQLIERLLVEALHKREDIKIMADVQVDININVSPAQQPLAVDVTGVPNTGTVGVPYSGVIKASGGTPPYTFTLTAGSFPDGVTLNPDGTITGTPGTAADFDATVDVADSAGAVARARVGNK